MGELAAVKLTDADGCTGSAYDTPLQWGAMVTHTVPVWGGVLCRDGVLHCYEAGSLRDALALALLRDPNDAHLGKTARAWVCQGSGRHVRNGIKSGYEALTTVREIPLPEVTAEQRAECAIRLALEVCDDPSWRAWAAAWLDGTDRTAAAARERALAARWAAEAAARAAADAAAGWAAAAAADAAAAWAAGWAAAAAGWAAEAAGWAAEAAARAAARAAADAAAAAAEAADVDVAAIAGRVLLPEWVDSGG